MDRKKKTFLLIGIIFIAFNLRAPLTAVGSLASIIRDYFHISNALTGFLTTLPLIVFAIVSPFVTKISSKLGNGLSMLLGLVLLVLGEIIRSYMGLSGLFIGTIVIATGICIGNVLIPSIIKLVFPTKVASITSIYTPIMSMFAAISSGVSIPLATGLNIGWQNALAVWSILAIIGLIVWLPQLNKKIWRLDVNLREDNNIQDNITDNNNKPVWKSPLSWYVTFFMGLQSILFYCVIAWLPSMVTNNGLDSSAGGLMLAIYQITGVPASFVVSQIANKVKDQRILALTTTSIYLIGFLGLWSGVTGPMLYFFLTFMGIGSGASISLALAFMGLRSKNAKEAGSLSGMAQSIGYLLGAVGPLLIGFLYDITGSFTGPFIFLVSVVILLLFCSFGAGRNKYLFDK